MTPRRESREALRSLFRLGELSGIRQDVKKRMGKTGFWRFGVDRAERVVIIPPGLGIVRIERMGT